MLGNSLRNNLTWVTDGNTGSVTLSDDKNRMLKGIDMIKFKEIQESDGYLQALWSKVKQNYSRYCISIDLLNEMSSKVDDSEY